MADYIDRKQALGYPLSYDHYDKKNGDIKFIHGVESYRDYIEGLPTVEKKHGRWIDRNHNNTLFCSECNYMLLLNRVACRESYIKDTNKYCRFCGAKMDEVSE